MAFSVTAGQSVGLAHTDRWTQLLWRQTGKEDETLFSELEPVLAQRVLRSSVLLPATINPLFRPDRLMNPTTNPRA